LRNVPHGMCKRYAFADKPPRSRSTVKANQVQPKLSECVAYAQATVIASIKHQYP
jgi:hypothetical protein